MKEKAEKQKNHEAVINRSIFLFEQNVEILVNIPVVIAGTVSNS